MKSIKLLCTVLCLSISFNIQSSLFTYTSSQDIRPITIGLIGLASALTGIYLCAEGVDQTFGKEPEKMGPSRLGYSLRLFIRRCGGPFVIASGLSLLTIGTLLASCQKQILEILNHFDAHAFLDYYLPNATTRKIYGLKA